MCGLSMEGNRMTFDPKRAEHRAERQIKIQQHRPLLDVQFQIRGGVLEFLAAVLHALEINADIFQRVGKFDALLVHEAARFVHVEIAGASRRAEQTFAEPRAFFIRPIHEADRHGRLAVILCVDAAENFHTRQHVQAAVQPAAVGHGIHVPADEQALFRFTAQCRPEISGCIGVAFDREGFEFFLQPRAGFDPHRRERDALRAVVITGEGAEFLEFSDGALWVG